MKIAFVTDSGTGKTVAELAEKGIYSLPLQISYQNAVSYTHLDVYKRQYMMLAQVIGRWGNFLNQEAFGEIVPEAYFDHFPTFIKDQMYIYGHYHAPTFLYEGIGNLIGFILIVFVYRKHGDVYKRQIPL